MPPAGPGRGAPFVLTLPAAEAETAAADSDATPEDGATRYRHRRVHYIEDNETNVEVMRGMLAQRPQVTLAVSMLGLDGLQAVRQQRPDLIQIGRIETGECGQPGIVEERHNTIVKRQQLLFTQLSQHAVDVDST